MILSFHPNIVADENILCAGRLPDDHDRAAICEADAIILPQGPSEMLYRMCREHCCPVFPNYDARFDFPGKVGQAGLFRKIGAPFPRTHVFTTVAQFYGLHGKSSPLGYPCVLKSDWGGQGDGCFLVETEKVLAESLEKARYFEKTGQQGFVLQEYVPHGGRSLRVVVMGEQIYSYWRRQPDGAEFRTNLSRGAVIDHDSDPQLQAAGKKAVVGFCAKTGINLAGLDLLFAEEGRGNRPVFLEINYYFGRKGLGGSIQYYELFEKTIALWLKSLGLSL